MWTSIHRSVCSVTTAASSSPQASSSSNHIGDLLHTYVTGNQHGPGLVWTRPAMFYPAGLCFHFVSTYLMSFGLRGGASFSLFPFLSENFTCLGLFLTFMGAGHFFEVGERKGVCVCPDTVCVRMCVVRGEEDDVVGTRGQGLEAQIHMVSFSTSQSATSWELEQRMIIKGPDPTTHMCVVGPALGVVAGRTYVSSNPTSRGQPHKGQVTFNVSK